MDEPVGPGVDERGTLEVRDKALQHVVERVALETPGTVTHTSVLGRLRGAQLPRAEITRQGRSARVSLDVGARRPCRVSEIAASVRDSVHTEAARMTGVHLVSVDVTVHALSESDLSTETERRVQ